MKPILAFVCAIISITGSSAFAGTFISCGCFTISGSEAFNGNGIYISFAGYDTETGARKWLKPYYGVYPDGDACKRDLNNVCHFQVERSTTAAHE